MHPCIVYFLYYYCLKVRAGCHFLTVLKQTNTICLGNMQIKNKATGSYSALKCVFCVGMCVFVLVCVIPPFSE